MLMQQCTVYLALTDHAAMLMQQCTVYLALTDCLVNHQSHLRLAAVLETTAI